MLPSKIVTKMEITFTASEIVAQIKKDLERKGYKIESAGWDAGNSKVIVSATKQVATKSGKKTK